MNLIETALSFLSAGVIQRASALVGESPSGTHDALEAAASTTVAGLAGEGSTLEGARGLMRIVEEAGLVGPQDAVTERLRSSSGEQLVAVGKSLIGRIFGWRQGAITDAAAASTGVRPSSMASLFGLAGSLVLGALGSHIHERRLDASGLAAFLGAQREAATSRLPQSVLSALGGAPPSSLPPPVQRPVPHAISGAGRGLWPLLLVIPLAVILGLALHKPGRTNEWPSRRLGAGINPPAEEQTGNEAVAPRTTIATELEQFLAAGPGNGPETKRFVFDNLNFQFGTAQLTPDSIPTIDSVAEVLKAYPNSNVLVEGHTDAVGAPADNQRLSFARANTVKNALIQRGVAADRIDTAGIGQDRPTDTNDTEEGRARNRRTELVVTKR